MKPPDDFSNSVTGCLGQIVYYLVTTVVLFFAVLVVCSLFRAHFSTVLLVWLGLMFFVTIFFLLRLSES